METAAELPATAAALAVPAVPLRRADRDCGGDGVQLLQVRR